MNGLPVCDTPPIRILGMGSENGVDQLGWLAARQLKASGFAARYPEVPVDVAICQSPALLAARYTPAHALILVDAWKSGQPAGAVRHIDLDDIESVRRPASSHGLDIRQALDLCSALENGKLPVSVIGISTGPEAQAHDMQPALDILEICLPALQEAIDREIRKLLQSRS